MFLQWYLVPMHVISGKETIFVKHRQVTNLL